MLRVALNGGRVAYTSEDFQSDADKWATFGVRTIGRRRHAFYRVYGIDSKNYGVDVQALDLVLCAGGQAVFIAGYGSDSAPGAPLTYDVRISDGPDSLLLARGPTIEPGTLRATPGRIAWMDAGSLRHFSTTCAKPAVSVAVPRLTVDDVFGEP